MPNDLQKELDEDVPPPEDDVSFLGAKLRKWLALSGVVIPAVLVVVFVVIWFGRRDRIPNRVTVETASEGSSYHVFGGALCDSINNQVGRTIASPGISTGSGANVGLVATNSRHTTMALYQGGSVALPADVTVVAPLYREVVHVLVKRSLLADVESVDRENPELNHALLRELLLVQKKEIYAGKENSGMRLSALEILDHYGLSKQEVESGITFSDDMAADIVISTTGMFSQKMADRLSDGDYSILSLQAEAIAHRRTYFVEHTIPRGFYRNRDSGPVPTRPVKTIATTAFLIAHREAPPSLVKTCLSALYKTGLAETTTHLDLIQRDDARSYLHGMRAHVTADEFYSPLDIGYVTTVMESFVASKDLLLAFVAGIYLLWSLRRRSQERKRQAEINANRVRLDEYVDQTIAIEAEQIDINDPVLLEVYLDQVTRIKLRALDELTDEALRDDRVFTIFLMQCANLISKIQFKILTYSLTDGASPALPSITEDPLESPRGSEQ